MFKTTLSSPGTLLTSTLSCAAFVSTVLAMSPAPGDSCWSASSTCSSKEQSAQTVSLDFRRLFPPLVNHADEAKFIADCAADVVGEDNVNRRGPVTMASEDFSYMLERVAGAYIQIGNGDGAGACEVHNPGYDFNDAALPLGASVFARLAERRLARLGRDEADASVA